MAQNYDQIREDIKYFKLKAGNTISALILLTNKANQWANSLKSNIIDDIMDIISSILIDTKQSLKKLIVNFLQNCDLR